MKKADRGIPDKIIETVLAAFIIVALLVASYDVMHIFFGIFIFALIFSISFSRSFKRLLSSLNNRRRLAAFIYATVVIVVIAIPLGFFFSTATHYVKDAIAYVNNIKENGLPALPLWIKRLPYVGTKASDLWTQIENDPKETIAAHQAQLNHFLHSVINKGFGLAGIVLQLIAGIIVSAVVLINEEKIMVTVKAILQNLFGEKSSVALTDAIAIAVKSVSIGVMGTAFISAVLSWIGLRIAHVPFAFALSALVFFLVLIQVGTLGVWVPVVLWMTTQGHSGMLVFTIAWGALTVIVDTIVKPLLIAKSGGKIPFLVLFIGITGGLAAWGFTGLFKGAIILSLLYTLFVAWLERKKSANPSEALRQDLQANN